MVRRKKLAWQVKPERLDHEEQEVVAEEMEGPVRSRIERLGHPLLLESRRAQVVYMVRI